MTWVSKYGDKENELINMDREEFTKLMYSMFPETFGRAQRTPEDKGPMSPMVFGFEVGGGWRPAIYEACVACQGLYALTGVRMIAAQIKEKFGTLRFYFDLDWDEKKELPENFPNRFELSSDKDVIQRLFDLVMSEAESQSACHCAECGDTECSRTTQGWILTLCDDCAKKKGVLTQRIVKQQKKEEEEREVSVDKV